MNKFWGFADHMNPEFHMFSFTHIITIIIGVLLIFALYKLSPVIKKSNNEKIIRYSILFAMIIFEIFLFRKKIIESEKWYKLFPDATCGWSTYLAAIMLITKSKKLF